MDEVSYERFEHQKKESSSRIRELARMHHTDRNKRGTPAERKEAAKLRASAMMISAAAKSLGWSVHQFNKVFVECDFQKNVQINGKSVKARFWFADTVEQIGAQTDYCEGREHI